MRILAIFFIPVLAFFTLSGCVTTHSDRAKTKPSYQLHNVYRQLPPAEFKRVALLPIVASSDLGVPDSLNSIRSSITDELLKTKKYEIIPLGQDELRAMAGVGQLGSLDVWPEKMRQTLQDRQIDGVIVAELTALKGYPPIALGLKARLVGLQTGATYWACDEVFDAAVPEIFAGAKRFEEGMLMSVGPAQSQGTIELSPSIFAKYAAYTMFETLP